jgi:hypothetical protein
LIRLSPSDLASILGIDEYVAKIIHNAANEQLPPKVFVGGLAYQRYLLEGSIIYAVCNRRRSDIMKWIVTFIPRGV